MGVFGDAWEWTKEAAEDTWDVLKAEPEDAPGIGLAKQRYQANPYRQQFSEGVDRMGSLAHSGGDAAKAIRAAQKRSAQGQVALARQGGGGGAATRRGAAAADKADVQGGVGADMAVEALKQGYSMEDAKGAGLLAMEDADFAQMLGEQLGTRNRAKVEAWNDNIALRWSVASQALAKSAEVAGMMMAKEGGYVEGVGSGDKIPALLEPGEMVLPRDVTDRLLEVIQRPVPGGKDILRAQEGTPPIPHPPSVEISHAAAEGWEDEPQIDISHTAAEGWEDKPQVTRTTPVVERPDWRKEKPVTQEVIVDALRKAGFSEEIIPTMVGIAGAESTFRAGAHNPKGWIDPKKGPKGDNSYGLFQINMLGPMGPERRAALGLKSNNDLYDIYTNARAAKWVYDRQGLSAWSVYDSGRGRYKDFVPKKIQPKMSDAPARRQEYLAAKNEAVAKLTKKWETAKARLKGTGGWKTDLLGTRERAQEDVERLTGEIAYLKGQSPEDFRKDQITAMLKTGTRNDGGKPLPTYGRSPGEPMDYTHDTKLTFKEKEELQKELDGITGEGLQDVEVSQPQTRQEQPTTTSEPGYLPLPEDTSIIDDYNRRVGEIDKRRDETFAKEWGEGTDKDDQLNFQEADIAAKQAALEDLINTRNSFKFEPKRALPTFWHKISAILAITMGAYAEGLSKGKLENTALKIINDAIKADIEQQQREYEQLGGMVDESKNLVSVAMKRLGNMEDAKQAAFVEASRIADAEMTKAYRALGAKVQLKGLQNQAQSQWNNFLLLKAKKKSSGDKDFGKTAVLARQALGQFTALWQQNTKMGGLPNWIAQRAEPFLEKFINTKAGEFNRDSMAAIMTMLYAFSGKTVSKSEWEKWIKLMAHTGTDWTIEKRNAKILSAVLAATAKGASKWQFASEEERREYRRASPGLVSLWETPDGEMRKAKLRIILSQPGTGTGFGELGERVVGSGE